MLSLQRRTKLYFNLIILLNYSSNNFDCKKLSNLMKYSRASLNDWDTFWEMRR